MVVGGWRLGLVTGNRLQVADGIKILKKIKKFNFFKNR